MSFNRARVLLTFLKTTRGGVIPSFGATFRRSYTVLGLKAPEACFRKHPGEVHLPRNSSQIVQTSSRTSIWPIWRTRRFHTGSLHRQKYTPGVGAEPGVDTDVSDIGSNDASGRAHINSDIKIIDYSNQQIIEQDVDSASLGTFLKTQAKPEWAACRWIYVNGLNWDVVRCLGDNKGLHRLAIEDVLDATTTAKVNWYDDHCYLELPLQKLVHIAPRHRGAKSQLSIPPSEFSESDDDLPNQTHSQRWHTFSHSKFGMSIEQVSIFLTADGTVVTFFENSGPEILKPILTRLLSEQTVIRSSNEPSMLVQAIIDAIVDLSLPIGKAVGDAFSDLELAVLTSPAIKQSRQLYVLRSGLTHLMENSLATQSLVKTLCDHRALAAPVGVDESRDPAKSVVISPLTQVYLQDVQDHLRTLSNQSQMSIRSAENLTQLIFNTIAASQNESVRQLTLVSCFFLPLTVLTSYYGMNFDPMPVVNNHSDAFFWVTAIPVMLATSLVLFARSGWFRAFRLKRRWRKEPLRETPLSGRRP